MDSIVLDDIHPITPFQGTYTDWCGQVFFNHVWHARQILLQDSSLRLLVNDSYSNTLGLIDIRDFWTVEIKNSFLNCTTVDATGDSTGISIQRIQRGKHLLFSNLSFYVESSSSVQFMYFDDERVTDLISLIADEIHGTIAATGAMNVFTLNSTLLNVTEVRYANSIARFRGIADSNAFVSASATSTCFVATVMNYGPQSVLVENISGTGNCIMAGGVGITAIEEEDNIHDMIVVDSVAALVPKSELEGDMTNMAPGTQARLMSKAMRQIHRLEVKI